MPKKLTKERGTLEVGITFVNKGGVFKDCGAKEYEHGKRIQSATVLSLAWKKWASHLIWKAEFSAQSEPLLSSSAQAFICAVGVQS